MKRKVLSLLLIGVMVLGLTGCGKSAEEKEKEKEVSLNSAYILDYDDKNYLGSSDQAYMIVVFDIKPQKDILLDNISMTMKVGDKAISGEKYDKNIRSDIVYDSYKNISSGKSGKIAYRFKMEKYLYKENDSFTIKYKVGTQKGEYSYIIEDSTTFKKDKIKEVDYLEEIVKGVYKDNSEIALMILSLKWKLEDVYKSAKAYDGLDFYTKTNYQCYDMGAREDGKKILNYFSDGASNNVSISNSGYLNVGVDSPERTYDLPALNYDTLEKYYPGIKEALTNLDKTTNDYANGLINVKKSGSGECFRDITIKDVKSKALSVDSILQK